VIAVPHLLEVGGGACLDCGATWRGKRPKRWRCRCKNKRGNGGTATITAVDVDRGIVTYSVKP
jgi:hypothetical protein